MPKKITYGYEQIANYYAELIMMGAMRPGVQLPATRQAAAAWSVSTVTVGRAWRELRERGLVEMRPGRGGGTFVRTPETQQPQEE